MRIRLKIQNILSIITKILFAGFIMFSSCVEKYNLGDQVDSTPGLVFEGTIMSNTEEQVITLSQDFNAYNAEAKPLANCDVTVEDIDGNEFPFFEDGKAGIYKGHVGKEYLVIGNQFRVHILNQDNNKEYLSDYEEMTPCSPVDSVYYEIKNDTQFVNKGDTKTGVQFYVDIKANDNYSRFYRWKLNETWEYHSTWPVTSYWIGYMVTLDKPDYSKFICYNSLDIPQVFTTSTKQLDENMYLRYPLQFVSNWTQKLYYRYSLLVSQMSVTEKAYYYWEQLKQNSQESGGLTDKQPNQIFGNIQCVTNPKEKVLGYFGVSDVNQKRIFVPHIENMSWGEIFCGQYELDGMFLAYPIPEDWPYYFTPRPEGIKDGYYVGEHYCFDCTLRGGTLELPDIWKEKK